MGSPHAWLIWVVGLLAYITAVLHRTSFGVSGLAAAARFEASPATLSGFVVLQLVVYAALQVPVGLLLDRYGSRRLIAGGALVMAAGQLLLALSTSLTLAYTARVLIAFDYARTFNPSSRMGTAQGMVNVGGFVASLLVVQAIGLVLGATGGYTPAAFRLAWLAQYPVVARGCRGAGNQTAGAGGAGG